MPIELKYQFVVASHRWVKIGYATPMSVRCTDPSEGIAPPVDRASEEDVSVTEQVESTLQRCVSTRAQSSFVIGRCGAQHGQRRLAIVESREERAPHHGAPLTGTFFAQ